jgi:hypothetical protein
VALNAATRADPAGQFSVGKSPYFFFRFFVRFPGGTARFSDGETSTVLRVR